MVIKYFLKIISLYKLKYFALKLISAMSNLAMPRFLNPWWVGVFFIKWDSDRSDSSKMCWNRSSCFMSIICQHVCLSEFLKHVGSLIKLFRQLMKLSNV